MVINHPFLFSNLGYRGFNFPHKYNFISRPYFNQYGLRSTNFYSGYSHPFLFSNLGHRGFNFPYTHNFLSRPYFNRHGLGYTNFPFSSSNSGLNFPYTSNLLSTPQSNPYTNSPTTNNFLLDPVININIFSTGGMA